MNTPTHDTTNPTTNPTATHPTGETDPSVLRACAELDALQDQLNALYPIRPTSNADWAARSARLAMVCARRAGWWRVLAEASIRDGVHQVYGHAVIIAGLYERDRARFWRESAAEWSARAEHRPTSDAAGALSNWDELGVTA